MSKNASQLKIIDLSIFDQLEKACQKKVLKAEKGDMKTLLYVAKSFIYEKNSFPKNVDVGMKYLQHGAEKKNIEAMKLYGNYLLQGELIPKDEETAINLLDEVATVTKNSEEKLELAHLILSHQTYDIDSNANENVNFVLAKKMCKEAAEYGNVKAMTAYGLFCLKKKENKYGKIVPNHKEALEYIKVAAGQEDPEGLYQYGYFNEFGIGGLPINIKEAVKYYKSAYEKGNLSAYSSYGYTMLDEKFGNLNEPEGFRLIKYSCDHNNPVGLDTYGLLFSLGLGGLEKNEEKSFYYIKKAADLGDCAALANLALSYKNGVGVEKNMNTAIKYCELAIEEGSCRAAVTLYNISTDPESGVPTDKEKALKYLKHAADHGSRDAISEYCFYLTNDKDNLEKNKNRLKKYLDKALELKAIDGMKLYGAILLDGIIFPKDELLALKIWKECASLGDKGVMEDIAQLFEKGEGKIERNPKEAQKYRDMASNQQSKCCLLI